MAIASQRFPFPLPSGWFAIAWADDGAPGAVVPLRAFARDLVLFRMQGGAVSVLDALCPHLGAHLGCGGALVGETIRCPFHHWRFAGDGACAEVPYARRVPTAARVRAWSTIERNGLVWVWNGAAGDAPERGAPLVPEYVDPRWTYGTRPGGCGEAILEADWRGLGIGITRNRFSGDLPG